MTPDARITDRRFAPGFNVRSMVIASQMAWSMMLLIPCGLFVRSWLNASEPTDNLALSLAVRATGDPLQLRAGIEREVKALLPAWPVFQFRTLDEGLQLQRALPRAGATVLGVLGLFGLLLAAVGVFGVMAYVVRQRTHEMGIRLALGAPAFSVVALVMKQGMLVCAAGTAVGLAVSLLATRLLSGLLYGIGAADPLTFLTVPLLLFGVALLACYLPARRVRRIDLSISLSDR